ncbi:hypothetical protein [Microbacterium jejuense]|uniref:PulJ/GspJ family protein n=1 Tax=Microbacterium jejuense TaxID=1263637 RepID=UPI0031E6E3D7
MRIDVDSTDAGLTLIELIVGLLVSTLVLIAIATTLANAFIAQDDVTTTTQATSRGQLMSSAVERAMRNARAYKVDGTDGNDLYVWTTLGGSQTCQAFRLIAGTARIASGPGPINAPSTWPIWQTGIAQRSIAGSPVLFFTETSDGVTYTFDIKTKAAPVRFDGAAIVRFTSAGGTNPCWS